MIRLYLLYLILGGYLLLESFTILYFSRFNNSNNILTYAAVVSSIILFIVASGLTLYHIKQAAIVGLIALIGVLPFGAHWLIYRYKYEWPLTSGTYNQVILIATVLYIVTVFYSGKYSISKKEGLPANTLKTSFKIHLAILPVFLFVAFAILWIVNP